MSLVTFSGRRASQEEFELKSMIEFFQHENVRSYLEIGARHGDTFYDIVSNLPPGSRALAVDLPGGMWGTVKSRDALRRACAALNKQGYLAGYMFGDSTDPKIVNSILNMPKFDAILIDGDHRYEGVKQDWENYGKHGKLVAFHDIVGHDCAEKVHGNRVEVPRLWSEIKVAHPDTVEFVASNSQMGIGCVFP